MNRRCMILSVVFLSALLLFPDFALAAASENDPIWGKLAGKAGVVGNGLRSAGFIIAGLGLVFFSFMAIFNKLSWKNLAYIMLSCFVLSAMWGLVTYFRKTDQQSNGQFTADTYGKSSIKDLQNIKGGVPLAKGTPQTGN